MSGNQSENIVISATKPVESGVLVLTAVKNTNSIRGKGLFAQQFIRKGTRTWRPHLDALSAAQSTNIKVFGKTEAIQFLQDPLTSELEKNDFLEKSYGDVGLRGMLGNEDEGVMLLPLDDSQYTNHAQLTEGANIGSWHHVFDLEEKEGIDPHSSYALRDIFPGEEILEDYNDFEDTKWYVELLHQHGKFPSYFDMKPHKAFMTTSDLSPSSSATQEGNDDELPPSYEELGEAEAAMVLASMRLVN